MTSRTVTTVVTADTMALGAAVFGYAGHSMVTPHQAIQNVWWTDERIEAKVTREFITQRLRPSERDQLNRPIFQGSGLTEDTYLDWILRKAKRIFLILVECAVTDQIFGLVDDAWDDEDLPISKEEVPNLALAYRNDEALNRRFYDNQFRFLLRPLDFHRHIDYAPNEVVPIEFVYRLAPAAALQKWSRIHLPKSPTLVYTRRKVPLGEGDEVDERLKAKMMDDIETARSIEHEHIAPIKATWSQKGIGYYMTSFVPEHNLKSFIDFRKPASMQKVKKNERSVILLEWLHCLAHAVAHLHRRRMHHGAISPSNVLIDDSNHVSFADLGSLESFQKDKKLDIDEEYIYAPPERFSSAKHMSPDTYKPVTPTKRGFFSSHKRSKSLQSSGSGEAIPRVPPFPTDLSKGRNGSFDTLGPQTSRSSESSGATLVPSSANTSPKVPQAFSKAPKRTPPPLPLESLLSPIQDVNEDPDQRPGDIFSLACIYLDIISYLLKRKPNEMFKHRLTKHKHPTGKGSHMDASFHNNLVKVHHWMEMLLNDASSQSDPAFAALPQIFRLLAEMLNPEPHRRPSAFEVQDRIHTTLTSHAGITNTHCASSLRSPSVLSIRSSAARTSLSISSRPSMLLSPFSTTTQPSIAAFPPNVLSSPALSLSTSLFSPPPPPKSPRMFTSHSPPRSSSRPRSPSALGPADTGKELPDRPKPPPKPRRVDSWAWVRGRDGTMVGVSG